MILVDILEDALTSRSVSEKTPGSLGSSVFSVSTRSAKPAFRRVVRPVGVSPFVTFSPAKSAWAGSWSDPADRVVKMAASNRKNKSCHGKVRISLQNLERINTHTQVSAHLPLLAKVCISDFLSKDNQEKQ